MPIGYKLLNEKKGKLYPLFVLTNEETPVNIWLPAKYGPRTARGKVRSKLGELAFRPGWHINDEMPYVDHIYTMHDGEKYQKDGCVWCEVEYNDDVSYCEKAYDAGWRNGSWSAARAQLDYIPVNGYYRYKTNPTMVRDWIIAGEMRVLRVLDGKEVYEICRKHGFTPLQRYQRCETDV